MTIKVVFIACTFNWPSWLLIGFSIAESGMGEKYSTAEI